MRQELDLFTLSIDSFYGRIGNVFLSTMFEIQRLLDDLAIEEKLLNETLVDAALTRDTFAKAMDIIYEIKIYYYDFDPINDEQGNLIGATKKYIRKPIEAIRFTEAYIEEIKSDPTMYDNDALKKAELLLKQYKESDILNMLVSLEEVLDSSIFTKTEHISCIDSFKSKLESFNNLSMEEKINSFNYFCTEYIEKNEQLLEIEDISSSIKSSKDVIEELSYEIDWITDWFSEKDLKKLAQVDSSVYFNIISIINVCKYFKDNQTAKNAQELITKVESLKTEGLELIN